MTDQISFVEPLRHAKRKKTAPAKIAEVLQRLCDWYSVNRPGLKSVTISQNDAYSIRAHWALKNGKTNGEAECRSAGFYVDDKGHMSWRGFDLIEQK